MKLNSTNKFSVVSLLILALTGCVEVKKISGGVSAGKPIAGAEVIVSCSAYSGLGVVNRRATTNDAGEYTVDLPPSNAIAPCTLLSGPNGEFESIVDKYSVAYGVANANITPITDLIAKVTTLQSNTSGTTDLETARGLINAKLPSLNLSKGGERGLEQEKAYMKSLADNGTSAQQLAIVLTSSDVDSTSLVEKFNTDMQTNCAGNC